MKQTNPQKNQFCQNCGEQLIQVPHIEYDGMSGSYEPYWECLNGCAYPECADHELTAEELIERGKVDTCTEYGIVSVSNWSKGAHII